MIVRLARESDYHQIMSLYNDFVGEDRYSKLENDSFSKVLNSTTNFVYVSEEEGKLVGVATFSVRPVIRYPKPIAELDEMYVDPDSRRHGVGKVLMQEVEKKAKELGCHRVYIESQYKHEQGHKFYESLGYKNYGYHFFKNL